MTGPGSNAGPSSNPDEMVETSNMSAGASAVNCANTETGSDCVYTIDGENVESTVNFQSGVPSGADVIRNFIDPLILEVPAGVVSPTGTYDTGSGPLPLPIRRANSFPVQPGMRMTAEVGTTFLFLDLPVSVTSDLPISNPVAGPVFSYTLSFQQIFPISATVPPVKVKPMLAGAVTLFWTTYYVPLLPCLADFAAVPAVTIPQASTPQDLETTLGDLIRGHHAAPCNHYTYNFTNAMPPAGLVFLPTVRR